MPSLQNGLPVKGYKGRQLSEENRKFLEKVRSMKGVVDAWASGSDLTFVKLKNFKVVCLRGQNTAALDEQLREMNKMNKRSLSLGNGLNEMLIEPFRKRTNSDLPPTRPKNIRDIIKRRTSETNAADLQLAAEKMTSHHHKDKEIEPRMTMSKVDENLPLTTADIMREHEGEATTMRHRASSFGSGHRKLSPTFATDTHFRARARSELGPRPEHLRNFSKGKNGYTDIADYFTYDKGLIIPPGSDINLISPRSSPRTVSSPFGDACGAHDMEEVKNGNCSRRSGSTSPSARSEDSDSGSDNMASSNTHRKHSPPTLLCSAKKRHSLPDIVANERPAASGFSAKKRPSLTGVVAYDSANIRKHDRDRQQLNARDIHPKKISEVFKKLTLQPNPSGDVKSDLTATVKPGDIPRPKSGILTFLRDFFTRKPELKNEPPPLRYRPQPRRHSVDSQLLFNQLCMGRQTRSVAHEKAIKVCRPGFTRPMYIPAATSLGGLPDDDPVSIPTHPIAKANNTNQLVLQGRRRSCPVIFESSESEESSSHRKLDKNDSILPRLYSENQLSKRIGLSVLSETTAGQGGMTVSSKEERMQSLNETDTTEESEDNKVDDDDNNEVDEEASELEGVTYIVDKRSRSSSKSESSDLGGHVVKSAAFHLVSDSPTSGSNCESPSEQNLKNEKWKMSPKDELSSKTKKPLRRKRLSKKMKVTAAQKAKKVMDSGEMKTVHSRLLPESCSQNSISTISISSVTDDGQSINYLSDVSSVTCSADESSD